MSQVFAATVYPAMTYIAEISSQYAESLPIRSKNAQSPCKFLCLLATVRCVVTILS
ncbi:hypothetical protein Spb1_15140 [Planctopirus ephydatiae]|uniref:Uncharacterized protein n=1 Tax=Planctopirus ephydatiae TaxID=2528019 RepID=A0A518GME8_9PLAN|nr:hypothetical protein Spb1_15140 [Planctopirus ephydatiae]